MVASAASFSACIILFSECLTDCAIRCKTCAPHIRPGNTSSWEKCQSVSVFSFDILEKYPRQVVYFVGAYTPLLPVTCAPLNQGPYDQPASCKHMPTGC